MKTTKAIKRLFELSREGSWLYTKHDLAKLFNENGDSLNKTIARLKKEEFLLPVIKGLYEFAYPDSEHFRHPDEVALRIRRGHMIFESLESAASKWSVISQIPLGHTMYMTTGRSGIFDTRYGMLEFVHTSLSPEEIIDNTVDRGPNRSRLATKQMTVKNLLSCRRSLDLIDWEEVEEDDE